MPQTILEVCNLNKKYTNFALKDVSFSLKEGIIYGFIGRNGAGIGLFVLFSFLAFHFGAKKIKSIDL